MKGGPPFLNPFSPGIGSPRWMFYDPKRGKPFGGGKRPPRINFFRTPPFFPGEPAPPGPPKKGFPHRGPPLFSGRGADPRVWGVFGPRGDPPGPLRLIVWTRDPGFQDKTLPEDRGSERPKKDSRTAKGPFPPGLMESQVSERGGFSKNFS